MENKKCIGRQIARLSVLFAVVVFFMVVSVHEGLTEQHHKNRDKIPFNEARIFFELNNTDGDLGIHGLINGEPWKRLEIEAPNERRMLKIRAKGPLRRQGLNEVFFESAEPTFDELSPKQFFRRFREGEYRIEGITLDGDELESKVRLSHVMPAPPEPTVNGWPMAENCDEETTVVTTLPVTIEWPEVTMSHPDPHGGGAAVQPPVPIVVHNYEIILEVTLGGEGNEFNSVVSAILPPGVTSFTVPEEFISLGDEFKYEVIVRGKNFNQTAIESCFVLKLE